MNTKPRRVDAHVHFWAVARGDYAWMTPAVGPIYRDFGPEDLRQHLTRAGMDEVVLVQAAETAAETRYLLSIAERTPFVAGVVGWVDLPAPGASDAIAALAASPLFKGARPMIQEIADLDWMLSPALTDPLRALSRFDLSFDALVKPPHLSRLKRLVAQHEALRIVIDHGAKPEIAAGAFDEWAEDMRQLARAPNVFCKVSGLVTEAAPHWTVDDLHRYVDHLLASFGPQRLMFGSDWPVVNLAGGYEAWAAAAAQLLDGLSEGERARIYGETAAAFYRLADAPRTAS
ncbi:MAG: amidohydrolase family protein [Hyphomonadaceae bacterium]|nr:amidohydrolase family protein [Hyphomonadaceae bacterium]